MTDYARLEQALTESLNLARRPVAIAFLTSPPAGVVKLEGSQPSGCSFWRLAAAGRTFYTVPSDHYNCPVGSYTHNIPLPPEREQELMQTLSLMTSIGYIRMEEVPGVPRLPQTPAITMYAPLSMTPVDPDVVLLAGTPRQLMLLHEAATRAGKSPLPLLGRPTCMAIPAALSGGVASSLGCIGNRVYTGIADDEFYTVIAGKELAIVAEQLATIATANARLAQVPPGPPGIAVGWLGNGIASSPRMGKAMRDFWHDHGLSIVLVTLFIGSLAGQTWAGWFAYNEEQTEHGGARITLGGYLRTGHFGEATFENWESEFLQMAFYILLTVFLFQKGSSESKRPDVLELVDLDPRDSPHIEHAPWPVKRGGLVLRLYENSLSIAFALLFLASFTLHATTGVAHYNEGQLAHGRPAVTLLEYVSSAQFWFESFQNWQSEFLSLAAMVVLSIFLRQRGSPESKPVDAPMWETAD